MIDGHRLVALLLMGGAGNRLWPVSSPTSPKQFLKLFGNRSLFQTTLARAAATAADEIAVVTGASYAATVIEQAAEIGLPSPRLILEPASRDSAPAVCAAIAWTCNVIGPDTLVAVLPADHFIPETATFAEALQQAAARASHGWLMTLGIRPTSPSTEFGYIQRGAPLGADGAHGWKVLKFHEKPQQAVAEVYLRSGDYDWNSGILVSTAGLFAQEAMQHMRDIWEVAVRAVATGAEHDGALTLGTAFSDARKSSLDYALLEKSDRVAMIPAHFAWHDIGNWSSVHSAFSGGPGANLVLGDAVLDDVSGALVVADGVKVVVCGLDDIVVVASSAGTFVATRSKASEIKRLLGTQLE